MPKDEGVRMFEVSTPMCILRAYGDEWGWEEGAFVVRHGGTMTLISRDWDHIIAYPPDDEEQDEA